MNKLPKLTLLALASVSCLSALCLSTAAHAEDLSAILKKVEQLNTEGNYSKALEELSWAKKELEDQYLKKLVTFLPDTLNGYTGDKPDSSSAMGFTSTSRVYKSGANTAKIEINGGSGAGAQGGMGGLAALGQMAAMMGQQSGQSAMRINGRTANLQEESGELTVFLNGGTMLVIRQEAGKVELKAMAEAINMEAIEKYLSGTK